jgi:mRNA interferase MazF
VSRRGNVVLVVLPGDHGKPHPAVVVQSDVLSRTEVTSCLVCPMSSYVSGFDEFRMKVQPRQGNGLNVASEVMVEKLSSVHRSRLRDVIGSLSDDEMTALDQRLLFVLGFSERPVVATPGAST